MNADGIPTEVPAVGAAYLTVRALDNSFALPLDLTRSVFKIETLTRVPLAPPHIVGLSRHRGAIVGVACLARALNSDAPALGVGALAVAIELGAEVFALAVEEIGDVVHSRGEEMPRSANHGLSRWAVRTGVVGSDAKLLPVLDPFSIFDVCRVTEAA